MCQLLDEAFTKLTAPLSACVIGSELGRVVGRKLVYCFITHNYGFFTGLQTLELLILYYLTFSLISKHVQGQSLYYPIWHFGSN